MLAAAPACGAYRDGFDSPNVSWELGESDCAARLALHERTFQPGSVHTGAGAEYVRLLAGQGTCAYLTLDIPPARAIQELRPALWIKSNRAGLRLRARVVFPRSRDPRNGALLTAFVEGDLYNQPGVWRQLTVRDIPLQIQRQARIMRAQPQFSQVSVDEREAYIDTIVLNAYGGAGVTDLWLDTLEIDGHTEANVEAAGAPRGTDDAWRSAEGFGPRHDTTPGQAPPHLEGAMLVAGRGPIQARTIEHRGEAFALLQSLGFNAVRLARPPTQPQLEEARRLNLGLVAPPPHTTGRTEITAAHDCVLAWDLGSGIGARELESVRRLTQEVRRDDPRSGRAVMIGPRDKFAGYRRIADILLLGDEPLGTSRGLAAFRRSLNPPWLHAARPAPRWTEIQTEPRRELLEQLDALAGQRFEASLEAAQIRLLVLAALESGATGFCFRSSSPLDASDAASQHRAAVLNAINQELALVEPWIAGPSHRESLDVQAEGINASLWATERSKLILLTQHHADDQFAAAACPPQTATFLISGAPSSWRAYRVLADRLAPVWSSQVGGGMRVSVPDVGRSAWIVVTDDALAIDFLARRLREGAALRARLWHDILSHELTAAEQIAQQAPGDAPLRNEAQRQLENARAAWGQCQLLLDAADFAGSLDMAERAEQSLCHLRRLLWSWAVTGFASRAASPCGAAFSGLPLHWKLTERVRSSTWGPNALAAGDFEDVRHMQSSGWTQERDPQRARHTHIELSPDRPQQGRYSLRLHAAAETTAGESGWARETPAVRVVSAPAPIERGALVRIASWVRVNSEITDRPVVKIVDSLGGEALADFHGVSSGWRAVVLYRAAPYPGQLTVTFELLEPGDVWIDAVRVESLAAPATLLSGPGAPPHQGAQGLSAGKAEAFAH